MMRQILFLATLLFASTYGLELFSSGFQDGARIPRIHTCDTSNFGISPELHWRGLPAQTKVLAMAVFDETNYGTFLNWLVTNIPKDATSLPVGSNKELPFGAREKSAWIGICPPSGELHTYKFEVYALSQEPESLPEDPAATVSYLRRHALSYARLTGVYGENLKTFSKRGLHAIAAENNVTLSNNTIPTTSLNGTSVNFYSTPRTTDTITPGRAIRVVVIFSVTFSSGGGCFTAGFGNITQPNAIPVCGSSSRGSLTFAIEQLVNTPQFRFYLIGNGTAGTNTTFSGSITIQQTSEPANQVALRPGQRVAFTLGPNGVIVYVLPPLSNIPEISNGQVLEVKVVFEIDVGAGAPGDNFAICSYAGFTPVTAQDTPVCRSIGSGRFLVNLVRRFQRGQPVTLVFNNLFARANNKRAAFDVTGTILANEPVLAAVAATGTNSNTCDQWTVINFNFADLVNK